MEDFYLDTKGKPTKVKPPYLHWPKGPFGTFV